MLLWPLAKLDIKKSISTIFCIKKKEEEEATQLLHLHCYKKLQYNSNHRGKRWFEILCIKYYTHCHWSNINAFKFFITKILALNCLGFCIELYSEIEANFNFQLTQKCLFVRGPYRWHMLNFFLSAEVAILDRQKKTKTFSAHQIASIIDTNGHAELEEYDIHGRGLSK